MSPTDRVVAAWKAMDGREKAHLRGRYQTAALADAAEALAASQPTPTTREETR